MSETEPFDPSLLAKIYDPTSVETTWYDLWEKLGYFQPAEKGAPYTIVIPPPNVTGSLHMGHALNNTLQDVITRYRKMQGDAVLWVPGTDHGGIATQNVVEKLLLKEGTSRHALGREKFLERMWSWRRESGDTILMQLRKLGATLDWSRTRFTMDEQCSKAVRHAFVELYNRKLLYRGLRLVNWCPRCNTALADIEVEHKDTNGHLWHIKYPIREKPAASAAKKKSASVTAPDFIVVATTRPETMLGDTAVAVHPKDRRYKEIVGARIQLPLTDREIPVVADDVVDKSFGSGVVKVTPAHDPVDFDIGERHKLPHINVIGFDGKMTTAAGPEYAGMDRFDARKKVVEELEKQGLLEKVEDHRLPVSVCYRCDQVIEPLESEQWFLSMAHMAKKGLDANKKGKVKIHPDSWESPYQLWMKNLRDWCVSRQIWWGHRIPAWYCVKNENGTPKRTACPPIVSNEDPRQCPQCTNSSLVQDSDVLDTWFSSALWPMSVLGWPDATPDLKRFYPTSTLVTGHEILYLWVARMIMFGLEFMGKIPYSTVLIHGIVRDKQGRKMSKSLGNVIDPLDLIKEFGADAVRFSLAQSAAPGRDMQISKENFVSARNFSNKIWNATRFSLMNLKGLTKIAPFSEWSDHLELADQWILHRYHEVIRDVTHQMNTLDLDAAARGLYDFFWSDYCDWYLEMAKPRLDELRAKEAGISPTSTNAARQTLATVLEGTLRMLHPFIPFITEELWQKIPKPTASSAPHIMVSSWPILNAAYENDEAARRMKLLQELVTKLRAIRSEMGIPVTQSIEVIVKTSEPQTHKLIDTQRIILQSLNSRVGKIRMAADLARPKASAAAVIPGADLYVPLEGLIDFAKERQRLEKELVAVKQDTERLSKKLANQDFLSHAPEDEVNRTRARLSESQERATRLQENISTLS